MSERSPTGSFSIDAAPKPGYAGDVDATQAWEALEKITGAVLVDVRTSAEWNYVGFPVLEELGKKTVLVEWQAYPTGELNPSFVDDVEAAGVGRDGSVHMPVRRAVGGRRRRHDVRRLLELLQR